MPPGSKGPVGGYPRRLAVRERDGKRAMECSEFLKSYSEVVDGQVEEPDRMSFELHLEACESCARYHRVVQRGLFIYRNLPELRPSSDFLPRLKHRLYHVDDEARLGGRSSLGSAALVVVAAVGLLTLAWLPFATQLSVEVALPPVAVEGPPEGAAPSLFSMGPFLTSPVRYVIPAAEWSYGEQENGWTYTTAGSKWTSPPSAEAFFRATSVSSQGTVLRLNTASAR